jgi:hypothetical protein
MKRSSLTFEIVWFSQKKLRKYANNDEIDIDSEGAARPNKRRGRSTPIFFIHTLRFELFNIGVLKFSIQFRRGASGTIELLRNKVYVRVLELELRPWVSPVSLCCKSHVLLAVC